jgi:hypothetical protein
MKGGFRLFLEDGFTIIHHGFFNVPVEVGLTEIVKMRQRSLRRKVSVNLIG